MGIIQRLFNGVLKKSKRCRSAEDQIKYFTVLFGILTLFNYSCSNDTEPVASLDYNLKVKVSPENSGEASPSSGSYTKGAILDIIGKPSLHYRFKEWKGDITGTSNPISITMNSNTTLTCVFELLDSDMDGVTDDKDVCPNTPKGEIVDSKGCASNDYPYIVWNKNYGSGGQEGPSEIQPTSDGGYIIGGIDYQSRSRDCYVIKIDKSGELEWEKRYGGSKQEHLYSIKPTPDGGYIFGGSSNSNDGDIESGNHGLVDYWVVKLDQKGIIEWERTYGGSKVDSCEDLELTSDGGYLLGGQTMSDDGDIKSGNQGDRDYWAVKIDSNGNIQWEKTFGGSREDIMWDMVETTDGGYLGTGQTESDDGDIESGYHGGAYDGWVIKIDNAGNLLWEKTFGGSSYDHFWSITSTFNGNYLMGGYTESHDGDVKSENKGEGDIWIVEINEQGEIIWERCYGGSGYDRFDSNVQLTQDGGIVFGGSSQSIDGDVKSGNKGMFDYWVVRTDTNRDIKWEKTFGGSETDYLYTLMVSEDGGYIVGGHSGSKDGDIKDNHGTSDIWVIKVVEE